jgi:hypothetical protein
MLQVLYQCTEPNVILKNDIHEFERSETTELQVTQSTAIFMAYVMTMSVSQTT